MFPSLFDFFCRRWLRLMHRWCCSPLILFLFTHSCLTAIFMSTPPSRPNKVGLKCPSVRLSAETFFDFNENWCVGTGRRVMHDGMQYDPIQGQSHEPLKVEIRPFSKTISPSFIMRAGKWPRILKLGSNTYSLLGPDFGFCHDFEVDSK